MIVEISYVKSGPTDHPAAIGELGPMLQILLDWPDNSPGEEIQIPLGQDLAATFCGNRLEQIAGQVQDLSLWRAVPYLIGRELWERASLIATAQKDAELEITVNPRVMARLSSVWSGLVKSFAAGRPLVLPRDPDELDRFFHAMRFAGSAPPQSSS